MAETPPQDDQLGEKLKPRQYRVSFDDGIGNSTTGSSNSPFDSSKFPQQQHQQSTLRALSYPSSTDIESPMFIVSSNENSPAALIGGGGVVKKLRRGRKTRNFSGGSTTTTSMADAMAEAIDQGASNSKLSAVARRQRHNAARHHQQHGGHNHHGKAGHRNANYKHRQKQTDQMRTNSRFAKFHAGSHEGEAHDFVHNQYRSTDGDDLRSKTSTTSGAAEGSIADEAGRGTIGVVTVDTDVTYKTFNTRKQASLPSQNSFPVSLLSANVASASFTASSLVSPAVLNRSLSIFRPKYEAGATAEKQSSTFEKIREDGPAPPSRQTSDGAMMASLDDRSAFHRTFSILVQLGAEPSSRRAHNFGVMGGGGVGGSATGGAICSTASATPALMSFDSRDDSLSEPSSLRQPQIIQFSDILWIYFQARRFNRKLPCCFDEDLAAWLLEQDNLIYEQRLEEGGVLNEVIDFRINEDEKQAATTALLSKPSPTGHLHVKSSPDLEIKPLISSPVSDTPIAVGLSIEHQLQREDRALDAASHLLGRFEHFQSLFKSSKAMESSLDTSSFTADSKTRLNILYGWSNIAADLRRKLFTICEMLELRKYRARRESLTSSVSSDAISRSNSSDPGSIGDHRRSTTVKSPAVKPPSSGNNNNNHNDSLFPSGANSPRKTSSSSTFLVTRTGSASLPPFTAVDIITALADTDYLKSYAEKCLKLRGMRKVLSRIAVIYGHTLWRARQILQRRCTMTPLASFWKLGDASDSPSSPFLRLHRSMLLECETDLAQCHVGEPNYQSMNLPSTFPIYFALLKVPLNLVYVWLSLRLGLTPDHVPDRMATNQLIQDARDCLEAATEVKTFYQDYVQAVVEDEKQLEKLLVNDMAEFEKALKEMFELYLRYIHRWVEYQCASGVGTRGVSREQNQTVMKFLEDEWKFAKRISINVLFGEAEAAHQFCHMKTAILKNMEELLETSLEEAQKRQYDDDFLSVGDEDREENDEAEFYSSSSSSSRSSSIDENACEDVGEDGNCHSSHNRRSEGSGNEDRPIVLPVISTPSKRSSMVLEQCRRLRTVVNELRNLANRSIGLARLLRHDLEIAAKFQLIGTIDALLKRLIETRHCLLKTPSRNTDFVMFCNAEAARKEAVLQFLLNVTCGRDDRFGQTTTAASSNQHGLKLDSSYILLVKCTGGGFSPASWTGVVKEVMPNADSNFALHHMDVDGVYMVMGDANQLCEQAVSFSNYVGADCVSLVDEQCSCHSVVAENMNNMKLHAVQMRQKLADWLKNITIALRYEKSLSELEEVERQNYRDAMNQAYSVAFEYHRELMRLTNAAMEKEVVRSLADFAFQWCQFITEVCDEGQGSRPRWATDGINYLQQISNPKMTAHLDEDEFKDLQRVMQKCLNHIIGSRSNASSKPSNAPHKISVAESPNSISSCPSRNLSRVSLPGLVGEMRHGLKNSPSSTRSSRDDLASVAENTENETFSKRAMRGISHLEQLREDYLRREAKLIGRCVNSSDIQPGVSLPLKRAGFRWQRLQHFVGRGRFGSVHTAVNLDTGKLMAVKQLKLQKKEDHQSMRHLLDEVTNFSKIDHPNLVRYFGAEAHQDEILIFMEYCDEGTLADACKDVMSEEIVRFYTLSLLQAVGELHRHNIVHRDIKPANIFLAKQNRSLKLGDFGCSVRLEGDETMMGELTSYTGTPAYMAPEVCTCAQTNGYGRSADIWSLGCVVLEMMTGKPPWHEVQEQVQILWKVGTGGLPDIPNALSDDCKEFLNRCLVNKPIERGSVDQLLELTFVKVKSFESNF